MTDMTTGGSRTLTAFFDARAVADTAVADLEAAGVPRQQIRRVDGAAPGATSGTTAGGRGTGFVAVLKDLFMPEEDRYGYAEGLGRGGFLVSVTVDGANYGRVTDILDRDGAVDMDEREASWRKEGWTGYTATPTASTPVMPMGRTAPAGTATAAIAGAAAGAALGAGNRRVEGAVEARGAAGGMEYIPVVEERLNVGKRDVSHGRVRLRFYVIETPVEEQVSLH